MLPLGILQILLILILCSIIIYLHYHKSNEITPIATFLFVFALLLTTIPVMLSENLIQNRQKISFKEGYDKALHEKYDIKIDTVYHLKH